MAPPHSPKEGNPPPVIGKVGRYTVFITPPATPNSAAAEGARSLDGSPRTPGGGNPGKVAPLLVKASSPSLAPAPVVVPPMVGSPKTNSGGSPGKGATFPAKAPSLASPAVAQPPPPVQVPPQQFEKPAAKGSSSVFGFFWDAVAKVQDAHSSLDEYLADWFGLNQSKYQWALNDYYESNGKEKGVGKSGKAEEIVSKGQAVQLR